MKKTTNWSLNDLVRIGADDLIRKGQVQSFEQALKKATAAILFVIRDEFISQLPKTTPFENAKFSIAIFEENDTVIVGYDGYVFEVNQRPNMGPVNAGFLGFARVTVDDDRWSAYVDKLKRIKDKANRLVKNMVENKQVFDQHAGIKDKTFLN